jgi:hypothetical protein
MQEGSASWFTRGGSGASAVAIGAGSAALPSIHAIASSRLIRVRLRNFFRLIWPSRIAA